MMFSQNLLYCLSRPIHLLLLLPKLILLILTMLASLSFFKTFYLLRCTSCLSFFNSCLLTYSQSNESETESQAPAPSVLNGEDVIMAAPDATSKSKTSGTTKTLSAGPVYSSHSSFISIPHLILISLANRRTPYSKYSRLLYPFCQLIPSSSSSQTSQSTEEVCFCCDQPGHYAFGC
jgi:hypothetical protein